MNVTAPLRLDGLKAKHLIPGTADQYNGVEMWKDLSNLLSKVSATEDEVDHDRALEDARDSPLPDGCSVQDFSDVRLCFSRRSTSPISSDPSLTRRRLRSSSSRSCPAATPPRAAL